MRNHYKVAKKPGMGTTKWLQIMSSLDAAVFGSCTWFDGWMEENSAGKDIPLQQHVLDSITRLG